jgi:hypothetical protein
MDSETGTLTAPPQPAPKEGSWKTILLTLLLFVVIGAAIWWSFTRQGFSGTIDSTGNTLGGWTMHVNGCSASSITVPKTFTLTDSRHPELKLDITTQDTEPNMVHAVSTVDGQLYTVEYDRCGVSDIHTTVPPGSHALEGTVKLDCMVGDSRLLANVSFQNCK